MNSLTSPTRPIHYPDVKIHPPYRAICQISAGERYAAEWRKKLADIEQRIVAEQQRMMAALEELKAAEAAQDSQAAQTSRPTPPDNGKTTDRAGGGCLAA